jgi:hypothetical protein
VRSARATRAIGIQLRVRVTGRGRITAVGTHGTSIACRTQRAVRGAGTAILQCPFTAATRTVIALRAISVALRVTFTPVAGTATSTSRTVKVERFTPRPEPVTG